MKGKTVVITGGASGIGRAVIDQLHKDNTVISLDRNKIKIANLRTELPGVISMETDITNRQQVGYALQQIDEKFNKIDVLINNAGKGRLIDFTIETPDSIERILRDEIITNYLAPIELSKKAIPLLLRSDQPTIVFVTSGLAYMPISGFSGYCASKAAMHSFTKSLRKQLKNSGVRVVDVLPPTVDTEFNKGIDAPKISPQKFASLFVKKLNQGADEIAIGQSKILCIMARLFPGFTFKMLNKG